jgi:hypothetical protein
MNRYKLQAEIGETLIRNLGILLEDKTQMTTTHEPGRSRVYIDADAVQAMLCSCAANLAQAYADRIAAPSHGNPEKSTTSAPDRTR